MNSNIFGGIDKNTHNNGLGKTTCKTFRLSMF